LLPFRKLAWYKILLFVGSVALFVVALELMKSGSRTLLPLLTDLLRVTDPVAGFGFGWLASYLVLSGSPIAAAALAFLDTGAIREITAFTMIAGTRIGGSLVVLLIGHLYSLRGRRQRISLVIGLLAIMITALIYIPAVPLGLVTLNVPLAAIHLPLDSMQPVFDEVGSVFAYPAQLAGSYLPGGIVFLLGLGATVLSLNLMGESVPEINLEEHAFRHASRILYRPVIVFFMGLGFTLLTMSVTVSLGLLVPLSARGYIRRENLVPYIMGCNISTLADTLVAALLLRSPPATKVVLAQMIGVFLISLLLLLLVYRHFERAVLRGASWVNEHERRQLAFLGAGVLIPILLLLIS
jgi:Na+/phosphate symporter